MPIVRRIEDIPPEILASLRRGAVIPAHLLALDAQRRLDARRQRALTRYYVDFYNSDPAIRNSAPYNTNYGTTEFKLDYLLAPHWTFSAGMQNIFNRQQPVNWNNVGAVMDPPARFLYANVRYSM